MDSKCYDCRLGAEWKDRYIIAVKRFDSNLQKAIVVTMVSVIVALICTIITTLTVMYVVEFVNSFEYVEETTYSIEQNNKGTNTAVIGGERVNIYGAEDNCN